MGFIDKLYKRSISSDKLIRQVWGALIQWRPRAFWAFIFLLVPLTIGLSLILSPDSYTPCFLLLALNLVVWLIIKVCQTLTNLFSLNRNDHGITACQILILAALGFWIIGFVLIFDIHNNGRVAAAIGIIGVVMGWIFQDRVKGVFTFLHLRMHHLLNIGDWIQVPKLDVDGTVKKVTLTTVTLYNWDTTTSTIPISALQSEHFVNLQHMAEGKTYGRRMLKSFTVDTETFRPISSEDVASFQSNEHGILDYLPESEITEGVLNAHLYRLYLHHWLLDNPYVSHLPVMLVRWMDHQEGGLVLQVYAFITESNLAGFEWQQARIVEHVLTSLAWFGLRLYQSPSAHDFADRNIHIVEMPGAGGKEEES